jgi:hypothetical protein
LQHLLLSSFSFHHVLLLFWATRHLLINVSSLKLWRSIIVTFCVCCTTMWKHVTEHHCEWTLQISSFDYSAFIVPLGQLYWLYIILLIPLMLTMSIHLLNQSIPPITQLEILRSHIPQFILHSPSHYGAPIPCFCSYRPTICHSSKVL